MAEKLKKTLIDFFSKLQSVENNRKEWLKTSSNSLTALSNYMQQLKHVSR